tara:strand:+ start:1525 stop:1794 length:270 start_codon:yes stop_codon:yes gene_type:complete
MIISDDFKGKSIKIWDVIEGPYLAEDMIPNLPDYLPENLHFNICKVETDGKVEHVELFFDDFNSAYDMVKHFKTSIDPIEIEDDTEDGH